MKSTTTRLGAGVAAALALLLTADPATAQLDDGLPMSAEGFAFDAADTDGDGLIGEAELARDAAAGFVGVDADADGRLTPDELGDHDPAAFERVDADGDGALSFSEVMDNKLRGLEAADQDGDGALSFDEMMSGAAAEQGGMP
jgi:Ca2+-binding EF-hand superfamily protein